MKYMSRSGLYKASNVSFDPKTVEAKSYQWWTFVKVINGVVVFNSYPYSNSTIKHQYKVRALLRDLGIEIGLEVRQHKSLSEGLEYAVGHCETRITMIGMELRKPRIRQTTKDRLTCEHADMIRKIDEISKVLALSPKLKLVRA